MATRLCRICEKVQTSRQDGVCDTCWKLLQLIEQSETQAELERFIRNLEADWRMLDRIDNDWRKRKEPDVERP